MSNEPFTTAVEVRFRDLDTMGHVNNALYATYLEEARAAYFEAVIGSPLAEVPTVLVHLELSYRRSITYGQSVEVEVRVADPGESSIPMRYEVRADGEVAATGETVQVHVDEETGESAPLPDEWRERMNG